MDQAAFVVSDTLIGFVFVEATTSNIYPDVILNRKPEIAGDDRLRFVDRFACVG